jgi:hypothetical protein
MTTYAGMQTNLRNYLGDTVVTYTWTDDQIKLFIVNAIANYSQYFPRRMNTTIDADAGDREYNLPYNVHGILSVEYQPLGISSTPRRYMARMDSTLDAFFQTEDVYDWRKNDISDAVLQPPVIIVNPVTAAAADTYYIEYNGDHAIPSGSTDVITVPDRHINLIYLYCRWQALQEISTGVKRANYIISINDTQTSPGTYENPYSEIDLKRTMDTYLAAIRNAQKSESESARLTWPMDKHGRIY